MSDETMQKKSGWSDWIDWAGDYDSLKFNRVAYIEEDISGVFFRQMVVVLVSIIHCLADIYHYRLGRLLLAEAM
jgi:hypothetical protein